jgi:5-methylcytosine-specific restriction endonuclease McrA
MSEIYIPITVQRKVITLSNGCCEYCLHPENYATDFFHFDHIIPVSKGGTSELLNIARSCGYCNGFKRQSTHYFDPMTGLFCPIFNPRNSLWTDHFKWSEDSLLILGRTDSGRATVELLQLNRQNVINLRQVLKNIGLHPPKFSVI